MAVQNNTSIDRTSDQTILGSVILTPPAARVGESVMIDVRGPDGKSYNNAETVSISINGTAGSSQYVVWSAPGTHRVVVAARRQNGPVERMIASIVVAPAPVGVSPPFLHIAWQPDRPGHAILSVFRLDVDAKNKPRRVSAMPRLIALTGRATAGGKPMPHLVVPALIANAVTMSAIVNRTSSASRGRNLAVTAVASAARLPYTFTVGNAAPVATAKSTYAHDFTHDLDPARSHQVFHVTATIDDPTGPVTIRRSISVANPYHMNKQRGVLQPPVIAADARAVFGRGVWRASVTVHNPETVPLHLTARSFEFVTDDAVAPAPAAIQAIGKVIAGTMSTAPSPLARVALSELTRPALVPAARVLPPAEKIDIVLAPRADTTIHVEIPAHQLPKNAIAMTIHDSGTGLGSLPVRVSAMFDIPEQVSADLHLSVTASAHLANLVASGAVTGGKTIAAADLRSTLVSKSARGTELAQIVGATGKPASHPLKAHMPPPNAQTGQECDPWNLPDVIPQDMFCLPTPETRWVTMPPRFMNARKGDIVIVPGNGSLISATLAAVSPPQPFSHSGMMTRNRDEITHSTASMERMTDSAYVGSGGFRPDILKYLWPGVITQTIKDAVFGANFVDPETGTPFTIGGFGTQQAVQNPFDGSAAQIGVAMVIKPDPVLETTDIRVQLHGIADFAAAQEGKSHYRFFCYTDPTIALNTSAPNESKWAAGTFPSVCSALIWKAVHQSGVTIEGALEPADINAGAQIAPGTPDGLYVYQADERLTAGEVLYERVMNLGQQAAGQFWSAIIDLPQDLGNQVLNAFSSDWADQDATESDKWRQTIDANAVSPQNLLFYDPPLYGFSEPLVFRDQRLEQITVYRWKLVPQHGTLTGLVRFNGKPAQGADVQINEMLATHTDQSGRFTIAGVPIGDVILDAQLAVNGTLMSAKPHATVVGNHTTDVTIDLLPPPQSFRRMRINGTLSVTNYEFAAAAYPHNFSQFDDIVSLDPGTATHVTRFYDCVADDDTLGRFTMTFDLQSDGSVVVKGVLRCYDSNKADTDDYDEGSVAPFTVPPGGNGHWMLYVDGENYAEVSVDFSNVTDAS